MNNQYPLIRSSLLSTSVLASALLYVVGCESVSAPSSPSEVATARELYAYVVAVARSVDPTARFEGAQMIETDNPTRFMLQYRRDNPGSVGVNPATADSYQIQDAVVMKLLEATRGDRNVGDGYAEKGAFYFAISTGLLALVVNADGTITYRRTISTSGKGSGELRWSVDTKDASNLFASANANFNRLRGTSHIMVWDLTKGDVANANWQGGLLRASPIASGDGNPRLDGNAPDYCELADFRVDAITGTILSHGTLHTPTSGKQGASRCDS